MPLYGDIAGFKSGNLGNLDAPTSTSGTNNTALLTVAIPARSVDVGQAFRLKLLGNCGSSANNGILVFRVHTGPNGTTSDAQAWISIASGSMTAYARAEFEGLLTVRAVGALGVVHCEARGLAGGTMLPTVAAAPVTPNINTLNPWYITLAAACSSGVFTAQQAVVEAI